LLSARDDKTKKLSYHTLSSTVILMAKNRIYLLKSYYNVFVADGANEGACHSPLALPWIRVRYPLDSCWQSLGGSIMHPNVSHDQR
jgi:hypothetical protein